MRTRWIVLAAVFEFFAFPGFASAARGHGSWWGPIAVSLLAVMWLAVGWAEWRWPLEFRQAADPTGYHREEELREAEHHIRALLYKPSDERAAWDAEKAAKRFLYRRREGGEP